MIKKISESVKDGDLVFVEDKTGILTEEPYNISSETLNYCVGIFFKGKIITNNI